MSNNLIPNGHVNKLIEAFNKDNFDVDENEGIFQFEGKIGIVATHRTAINSNTKKKKKAYYVEGNHYQMGYLNGLMAEQEISTMTVNFVKNIVFDFVNLDIKGELRKIVGEFLFEIVLSYTKNIEQDIPEEYKREMQGILDGCRQANTNTKVEYDNLFVLNVGIDALLSVVYSGKFPKPKLKKLTKDVKKQLRTKIKLKPKIKSKPNKHLRIPIMCNGFSIFGEAAGGNSHFMGRDFMFPTANVFQNVACLTIYNSDANELPIVSMTAPGIIGSIAAMNTKGVACGVDMAPSGNCDPDRPGMNSLPLVRHSIVHGDSCEAAVDVMVNTQRGVSWIYVLADGTNDKSCIVETGKSTDYINYLKYPPWYLRLLRMVPTKKFIDKHSTIRPQKGLMVRWSEYKYSFEYITKYNKRLWKFYKPIIRLFKNHRIQIYPDAFDENGYINKTKSDKNCPYNYYFAPQRDKRNDIVLTTNHFIVPEMRLCAMFPWSVFVAQGELDDIQWRYDELNYAILSALKNGGAVDFDKARDLISFLKPDGKFKKYYNPDNKPLSEVQVFGSISILDLKNKIIKSLYGYFADEWVRITLPNYIK
jgi:hypothetical protein